MSHKVVDSIDTIYYEKHYPDMFVYKNKMNDTHLIIIYMFHFVFDLPKTIS